MKSEIVVAFVGLVSGFLIGSMDFLSASRGLDVRMIELGVSILAEDPTPESRALREWAVAILAEYSPVELPDDLQRSLEDSVRLPRPKFGAVGRWTSDNEMVARVGTDGQVTAVGPGDAEIEFCVGPVCSSTRIHVEADPDSASGSR